MKVYISTPVNGRSEATLEKKREAAYRRVCQIRRELERHWKRSEFHSAFDEHIAPIGMKEHKTEAEIMGQCITAVIECSVVVLDYGWKSSRGCRMEANAAHIYGRKTMDAWFLNIKQEQQL